LIKSNDRLGMNVVPAGEVAKQIDAVYKAGVRCWLLQVAAVDGHHLRQVDAMTNSRTMRLLQAAAGLIALAAGWQILSMVFPHYLFPPIPEIFSRTIEILTTGSLLIDVLLTAGRIFGGLFGAFILGGILAMIIGQSRTAENFIAPVLTFFQGIPALSWVVFAIIWFHGIEFRVLFIMVMTTLPPSPFRFLTPSARCRRTCSR
jgi:ABC-type nitrate/sulfonate/bicarbonate transport system permease component